MIEYGVMDENGNLIGMPNKHFAERDHAEGLREGLTQASARAALSADAAAHKLATTPVMSVRAREALEDDLRLGRVAMAHTYRIVQREVGQWTTTA